MQGIIAIEQNLTQIGDVLEQEGYEVVDLDTTDLSVVDAIVVSGLDNNFMNVQNTVTDVPVISANGKTPDDILEELSRL